jgi:hypothetical protein
MFRRLFRDHPASLGESYFEHFGQASRFGARMVAGGAACVAHAVVPGWFETTGSRTVAALHAELVRKRAAARAAAEEARTVEWVI